LAAHLEWGEIGLPTATPAHAAGHAEDATASTDAADGAQAKVIIIPASSVLASPFDQAEASGDAAAVESSVEAQITAVLKQQAQNNATAQASVSPLGAWNSGNMIAAAAAGATVVGIYWHRMRQRRLAIASAIRQAGYDKLAGLLRFDPLAAWRDEDIED
jgi:hypothetical protein